ncbi:hypothetical protein JCM14036_22960 [Desulfotomaculum defluvii]
MDFSKIKLPSDMVDTLDQVYRCLKVLHPRLTESVFLEKILADWLKQFKKEQPRIYKKDKVLLHNDIKNALELAGKSQNQIAEEIGVNRTYLGQVVRGEYEPGITIALLLAIATSQRVEDLFFLTPADE